MGHAAAEPPTSTPPGRIVVLNGAPRAGKSSIAAALHRALRGGVPRPTAFERLAARDA